MRSSITGSPSATTKSPSSNKFETAHQLIEVTEPVSPADKKKLEESRKNDREQVEPTSADDQPGPDQPPPAAQEKRGDEGSNSGQQGDAENGDKGNKTTSGQAGTGNSDETAPNPNPGGATGDQPPQVAPEDKPMAEKLRQAFNNKNQSGQAGKQGQSGGNPPQNNNNTPGGAEQERRLSGYLQFQPVQSRQARRGTTAAERREPRRVESADGAAAARNAQRQRRRKPGRARHAWRRTTPRNIGAEGKRQHRCGCQ